MFNRQLKGHIKALDLKITELTEEMVKETDEKKRDELIALIDDLVDLRDKLSTQQNNSSHKKELISGAFAVGGLLLVLNYEKKDIIRTQAFGMVTKLFRG